MSDEAYIFTEVYRVVFEQTGDPIQASERAKGAVWAYKTTQGVK